MKATFGVAGLLSGFYLGYYLRENTNIRVAIVNFMKSLKNKEVNEDKSSRANTHFKKLENANDNTLNKSFMNKTLKEVQLEDPQESKNPMYQEIRDSALKLKPISKKAKESTSITIRDDFIKDEGMKIALEQIRKYQRLEGSIEENENSFDD